ncbi:MAG: M67 family metallopeptidase [Chloroflexota bacterium]|nr:M67 family metallopeptidase [Chloroflexota bacterium]MDE2946362.1 M67 family metallopeptidase [Chloroflexota bacterium]
MAVSIPYPVARQIADHAEAESPNEACGLIAGESDHIAAAHPLRNIAPAPETQFQADPEEQLRALKAIDAAELDWLGVYHSHPCAAPIPSEADIRDCADAGLLHLIVSLERAKPQLKLWRLEKLSVTPIDLLYDTDDQPAPDRPLTKPQQAAVIIVGIVALLIMLLIAFTLLPPAPDIMPAP